jgi:hypothetical protein
LVLNIYYYATHCNWKKLKTPWPESASELYRATAACR